MRCNSGKRAYRTETLAVDALLEAHVHFDYRPGTGPVNFYKCEECGEFHLTSRGASNSKLTEALANGTIYKLKRAAAWNDKLKGR
ncbi:MAG: hypothetical protein KF763_02195 [Cyclobacteriaceae bacterium]|nr:hypothetical protein [Cyclobacteriaceae bacterium]